ncbi:MAG: NUDIX domain-containing protein [Proteobacteria bacterium]|nr:NUDIX domain-containing protein [Pseudomonadota bacterium]
MTDISDRVRIESVKTLSDNHYILKKVSFAWRHTNGAWYNTAREVYDRGDGCAILLYDPVRRTVILTRQFRMPLYLHGHRDLFTETAAGLLDDADPEARIKSEAEEETGYTPKNVRKVMACYTSPGAVTEKIHLFVGEVDAASKSGRGGGLADEGEDIEVLELPFAEAVARMQDGRICDAKTIMLLQYAQLHIFAK